MGKKKAKEHKGLIMAGIKPGLASSKHREKMGPAIWPFLYLLKIPMMDGDDGILQTPWGHKFSRCELILQIQEALDLKRRTAYDLFNRLVKEGYLTQREDGTWEIAKYQNFRMFLEGKKQQNARSASAEICTESAKNCTESAEICTALGSKQGHKNKNNKNTSLLHREEKTPPPSTSNHKRLMALYRDVIREDERLKEGKEFSAPGKENKAAQAILQVGFTPEEAIECYRHFKAEPFWRGKHLSLAYIAQNIGAWKESKNETDRRVSRKPGVSQEQRDYYAAHLDPKD